jgi:Zn-dependent peptidase ImmA (M78 family)
LSLCRLELDGLGSPADIAKRIHELSPDLPSHSDIEDICRQLDILAIEDKPVTSFEAMLLMDENKACGSIVVAQGRRPERRRFSIGHELGHFLIPTHKPKPGEGFSCSLDDLRVGEAREHDRHKRIEAEANRFAAHLLMPPVRIRSSLRSRQPDLGEIVRLAGEFGVSREAMARGYIDAHRDTLAVVILHRGRTDRIYRPERFPWVEPRRGRPVPEDSIASDPRLPPGQISEMEECEPETWFDERGARGVEVLSEQLHVQQNGWATVLLHAELAEQD